MIVKSPKFRGDQSNVLRGKQRKICYVMILMVFILSGLCGDSPDHGGDQCLQYWSAVTFKISLPHATALLLQTSGFKPRNFFSHFVTFLWQINKFNRFPVWPPTKPARLCPELGVCGADFIPSFVIIITCQAILLIFPHLSSISTAFVPCFALSVQTRAPTALYQLLSFAAVVALACSES